MITIKKQCHESLEAVHTHTHTHTGILPKKDGNYLLNERALHFNAIKKEKGITLVALIVTIIVLLILAGVSIATLTGDNRTFN
jgi:hypothetical protein